MFNAISFLYSFSWFETLVLLFKLYFSGIMTMFPVVIIYTLNEIYRAIKEKKKLKVRFKLKNRLIGICKEAMKLMLYSWFIIVYVIEELLWLLRKILWNHNKKYAWAYLSCILNLNFPNKCNVLYYYYQSIHKYRVKPSEAKIKRYCKNDENQYSYLAQSSKDMYREEVFERFLGLYGGCYV